MRGSGRFSWATTARLVPPTGPSTEPVGLLDFQKQTSPHLSRAYWLEPLATLLERSLHEPIRAVVNVPPQHGKSELILHHIPRGLLISPRDTFAYVSYATEFSRGQSRKARRYAIRSGVRIDTTANRLEEWLNRDGGGLFATGIGGPLTGRPVKRLLVDDPIKNREEAESPRIREGTWEWLTDVAMTRLHPDSSAIVVQTRWHVDDVSGRLIEQGWDVLNLPAIGDDGRALWPEQRPIDFLERQREQLGAYSFESMYQGRPRPRGGAVFEAPSTCTLADIPPVGRTAIGVDLSYTAKTKSDWSGRLVLRATTTATSVEWWVVDVYRKQQRAPESAAMLRDAAKQYPGARMIWHCSGTELGSADLIKHQGVPLEAFPATTDKFVRSQGVAAQWNLGRVHVPTDAPWYPEFIREICSFTGLGDVHDDMVDMLSSAFSVLQGPAVAVVQSSNRRRTAGLRSAY